MTAVRRLATLIAALLFAGTGAAAAEPLSPVAARAAELPALFAGKVAPEEMFSARFLAEVPPARLASISDQLRASYGAPGGSVRLEARNATSGVAVVDFERATVQVQLAVAAAAPHLIEGLLIAGAQMKADDLQIVSREIGGLGEASFAVARLEDSGPVPLLAHQEGRAQAVGSAFKLFVLAELVRQVRAGDRRWDEVVPLGARSLPSGILQDWPRGSPLTLHSLAALMISRSDNTASDALLHLLGREKVEEMLETLGVEAAARNRPFLSTREAFALKFADPALLAAWNAADEAARRALLPRLAAVPDASIDPGRADGAPRAIETVEWFASPADLVRTLDWIRRSGDRDALDILAINPGLGPTAAEEFDYFGFKGGSEAGVINMSFLLRNETGRWLALSVTWNDPREPLDEARFVALVARLVALLRRA